MPITRDNGAVVPVNSDAYRLTADLATMADSLSLITAVSGQPARDALTKWVGRTVRRLDKLGAIEWWNGVSWVPPAEAQGQRYRNRITTPTGQIGTTITVVSNIATFDFLANRKYRLAWQAAYATSTDKTYSDMTVATCPTTDTAASVANLTVLEKVTFASAYGGLGQVNTVTAYFEPTADVTLQVKFLTQTVVGGTVFISAYTTTIHDDGAR